MDDMINRHNSLAEENIDPHGRPASNKFAEWSNEMSDRADDVYKDNELLSEEEREKRLKQMEEVVKKDLE